MCHLSAIANGIIIVLVAIETVRSAIIMLALSSCSGEETLLALPATAYTRWIVGIVDAAHITLHLSTPTWYTGLIDALVLRCSLRLLGRRRAAGSIGALRM